MPTQFYGIRHHGAGSAKSLSEALKKQKPDVLLVEGPPDAEEIIPVMLDKSLKPPVAMLIYDPKNLSKASFYPFASFSPEWIAIKYALSQQIPVQLMDMPAGVSFALDEAELPTVEESSQPEQNSTLRKDPLAYIAEAAGYADGERWWEVMVEHRDTSEGIFPAIAELMSQLRKELNFPEPSRDLQREAFMRKILRDAEKQYKNVAVVCGAWHVPALIDRPPLKADQELIKGLKKIKTQVNWIPWTYEKLSVESGYGAGVVSPAWYELVFKTRTDSVIRWFVEVARLFRKEDLDASSAHVIEAVRMSESLAAIRDLSLPGIQEMYEAAVAVFCGGYDEPMQIIRRKLIIGDKMGTVPDSEDVIPLHQDIKKLQKSLRLPLRKPDPEKPGDTALDLDLRNEYDLQRSHFLHRLDLLGIIWAEKKAAPGKLQGTFHEYWSLDWKPELALKIIEVGIWGNTVFDAAGSYVQHKTSQIEALDEIGRLLLKVLDADLDTALQAVIQKMMDLSALSRDTGHLMRALSPMVKIRQYGNVRKTDLSMVAQVIEGMIPRICAGLPGACQALSEEAAQDLYGMILAVNADIKLLNEASYQQFWEEVLVKLCVSESTHPLIRGACARLLLDQEIDTLENTQEKMSLALSTANQPKDAAHWLEGFLHGNASLLLHNYALWQTLDQWVNGLSSEVFQDMLPLLRRTFANYSIPERQKIADLAKYGGRSTNGQTTRSIDPERAQKVLPLIRQLFQGQ
ncbi:MAG: DUF5682 family protein [Microscillaceae bacterium]|nr:DUF5682 family protein [Microscillaceae bacterium]